jgi:hypothetical protein
MQLNHIAQHLFSFWAIQIIHDTSGGVNNNAYCLSLKLRQCFFCSFCVLKQDNALKDKQFLINVRIQIIFGSIISDKK